MPNGLTLVVTLSLCSLFYRIIVCIFYLSSYFLYSICLFTNFSRNILTLQICYVFGYAILHTIYSLDWTTGLDYWTPGLLDPPLTPKYSNKMVVLHQLAVLECFRVRIANGVLPINITIESIVMLVLLITFFNHLFYYDSTTLNGS